MTDKSEAEPHACGGLAQEFGPGARLPAVWCTHTGWLALQGASDAERPVLAARRRQHRPADAGGAAAHREGPHGAWWLLG